MGFKRGVVVGMGIGYVLGAKAGRQRYEEIRQAWGKLMGNPQVKQGLERGKDMVESGAQKSLHAVQEGAEKVTEKVKEKVGKDEETGTAIPAAGASTTPKTTPKTSPTPAASPPGTAATP